MPTQLPDATLSKPQGLSMRWITVTAVFLAVLGGGCHRDTFEASLPFKLTKAQQETLKQWITEGAKWPEEVKLQQREKVDFVKQVKPIIEVHCVACHKEGHAKGDLRMDSKADVSPICAPRHNKTIPSPKRSSVDFPGDSQTCGARAPG